MLRTYEEDDARSFEAIRPRDRVEDDDNDRKRNDGRKVKTLRTHRTGEHG